MFSTPETGVRATARQIVNYFFKLVFHLFIFIYLSLNGLSGHPLDYYLFCSNSFNPSSTAIFRPFAVSFLLFQKQEAVALL